MTTRSPAVIWPMVVKVAAWWPTAKTFALAGTSMVMSLPSEPRRPRDP
jgi:hypothetical protein